MTTKILIPIFALSLFFVSCKDEEPVETPDETIEMISDTVEYKIQGDYVLPMSQANNIKIQIQVVGAGGGGGGGQDTEQTAVAASYSGGGGGGAGQVVESSNISLDNNSTLAITVGKGGLGGRTDNPGINGTASSISVQGEQTIANAAGGEGGGYSQTFQNGGLGGNGYPSGEPGEKGKLGETLGGAGGTGGDNGSGYGAGGNGGRGKNMGAQSGQMGSNAQDGYVRIIWTGEKP
jgi:hypothetical protein